MNINKQLELYKNIYKIREVEKKISSLYFEQEMRCPVHLSIGQEAIPVGICSNLKSSDQILSAHRAHAHYLAKGGNLKAMISEIYGKVTGCSKGMGGSMHLIDKTVGFLGSTAVVANTIPVGVGLALSMKIKRLKDISCVFFGDGAIEEGAFYESINFAIIHKLPVLFICENNFFSVYSPLYKRQSSTRKITNISRSLGINCKKIDGNDVEKIYLDSKKNY